MNQPLDGRNPEEESDLSGRGSFNISEGNVQKTVVRKWPAWQVNVEFLVRKARSRRRQGRSGCEI